MDALLTQRSVAKTIVEGGGDYVMLAKGNQANLEADVALVFTEPPEDDPQLHAETTDRAHGRVERRRLQQLAGPPAGLPPRSGDAPAFDRRDPHRDGLRGHQPCACPG